MKIINWKLIKECLLIALLLTPFTLLIETKGIYDCRGPEFCGSEQLQWGWPLPFILNAALNSDTQLRGISLLGDEKVPLNFLVDVLLIAVIFYGGSMLFTFLRKRFQLSLTQLWSIAITALVTTLFAGTSVYFWQQSFYTEMKERQNRSLVNLENSNMNLRKEITRLEREKIASEQAYQNLTKAIASKQAFPYSLLKNWKTFRNENLRLEFLYPPEFLLNVRQESFTVAGDVFIENRINLSDAKDFFEPGITIIVNPMDFEDYYIDKGFDIGENDGGQAFITNISSSSEGDPGMDDGITDFAVYYESKNGNKYRILFDAKTEITNMREKYFEMFKQFIETLKFF